MSYRDSLAPLSRVIEERADYRCGVASPPGSLRITETFHKALLADWNEKMVDEANERDAADFERLGEKDLEFVPEKHRETMDGFRLFGMEIIVVPDGDLEGPMVLGPNLGRHRPTHDGRTVKQYKDEWRAAQGLPPLDIGDRI